jgi:hypothetical protein
MHSIVKKYPKNQAKMSFSFGARLADAMEFKEFGGRIQKQKGRDPNLFGD